MLKWSSVTYITHNALEKGRERKGPRPIRRPSPATSQGFFFYNPAMSLHLKLRAWDEGHKTMQHNFQFISSGTSGNDWIVFVSDECPLNDSKIVFDNPFFRQQFHIMQCAGVCDCDGNEIYEWDIVGYENNEGEIYCTIEFRNGSFAVCKDGVVVAFLFDAFRNCKVRGNVYQTPDLLNPEAP